MTWLFWNEILKSAISQTLKHLWEIYAYSKPLLYIKTTQLLQTNRDCYSWKFLIISVRQICLKSRSKNYCSLQELLAMKRKLKVLFTVKFFLCLKGTKVFEEYTTKCKLSHFNRVSSLNSWNKLNYR